MLKQNNVKIMELYAHLILKCNYYPFIIIYFPNSAKKKENY